MCASAVEVQPRCSRDAICRCPGQARNIDALSRDFIYLPEQGRNIMVDVRAITEALDNVYDADRIVEELVTGRLVTSEADADESVR